MKTHRRISVTPADYPRYLKLRKQGILPKNMRHYLTAPQRTPIKWTQNRAEITIGKYRVVLEIIIDECPDLSYLGSYSYASRENAIDRLRNGDLRPNQYRYWNPTGNLDEMRVWYRREGMSKHDAWLQARRRLFSDYRLHEEHNSGIWSEIIITAVAFLDDIECGYDALGGVTSIDAEHVDTSAYEVAENAAREAATNTPKLIQQKEREIALLTNAM